MKGAFCGEEDFYAGAEADEADFFSLGDFIACFKGAYDAACDEAGYKFNNGFMAGVGFDFEDFAFVFIGAFVVHGV